MKKVNNTTKTTAKTTAKPSPKTTAKTTPVASKPVAPKTAVPMIQAKPATAEQLSKLEAAIYTEQHSLLDGQFVYQILVHGELPPITINGMAIDPAIAVELLEFGSRKKFQNNYAKSASMTPSEKIDAMLLQLTAYTHGYFLSSDYVSSLKPASDSSSKSKPVSREQRIEELLFKQCLNSVSEEQQMKMAKLPMATVISVLDKTNGEKMDAMRATATAEYEAELAELENEQQEKHDAELAFLNDLQF